MDSVNDELTGDFHDTIEAIGMIVYTCQIYYCIKEENLCFPFFQDNHYVGSAFLVALSSVLSYTKSTKLTRCLIISNSNFIILGHFSSMHPQSSSVLC